MMFRMLFGCEKFDIRWPIIPRYVIAVMYVISFHRFDTVLSDREKAVNGDFVAP